MEEQLWNLKKLVATRVSGPSDLEILPFQPWLVDRGKVNPPDPMGASLRGQRENGERSKPSSAADLGLEHGGAQDGFASPFSWWCPRSHVRRCQVPSNNTHLSPRFSAPAPRESSRLPAAFFIRVHLGLLPTQTPQPFLNHLGRESHQSQLGAPYQMQSR